MKRFLCLLAFSLTTGGMSAPAWSQLTPNTQQLNVSDFFLFNPMQGALARYQIIGFYEPVGASGRQRVMLMPRIQVRPDGVSFIARNGATVPETSSMDASRVAKIKVSLRYDGGLPEPSQRMAVLAQLRGSGERRAIPDFYRYDLGKAGPLDVLPPPERARIAKLVADQFAVMDKASKAQEDMLAAWSKVDASVVPIQSVRIALLLDGEQVAERAFTGSLISSGVLPDLYVDAIDEYRLNRFRERQFQVRVDYGFLDASTASIEARFEADKVLRQLVEESRKMTSSSSQRGVQILGFGSRRSKIKQFLAESSREQITQDGRANTFIEMRDADDSMLALFESKFFPEVAQAKVAEDHLKAGEAARSAGNEALAAAHFGYAKAIAEQKLDLDVDTAGAIAALNAGDYAGFVAKGVKIQKSEGSAAAQYSRVLTKDVKESDQIDWNLRKVVSTQRSVTQLLEIDGDARLPFLGLMDFVHFDVPLTYNTVLPLIVPIAVVKGSPLDKVDLRPGVFLAKIGGSFVRSVQQLEDKLNEYAPGDTLEVERVEPAPGGWRTELVKVKLTKGYAPAP